MAKACLEIETLAKEIIENFSKAGLMVATAESCTGGLIAGALTDIAGSSSVVDRGYVTYSNEAKTDMLNVPADIIATQGAVSAEVAAAMVSGALARSKADIAVAVTGIAGPGGGSPEKPVGLVYIAVQRSGKDALVSREMFGDIGRDGVRKATIIKALQMMQDQARP